MKVKTKEGLLASYKKASKPERLVIIGRAGFTSEVEYFAYLDTLAPPAPAVIEQDDAKLDMVIAFDTTGSMSSYIDAVKAHVRDLIPKLFEENKDLQLKIVAFGDYCDMQGVNKFGPAYQDSGLTSNQNHLITFVNSARRTSGGDGDEFYELVIKKINEETPWRPDAKKAVLLIADYNPHDVGYYHPNVDSPNHRNTIDWKQEAQKAKNLGIQWDTMTCVPHFVSTFYKPLSDITGGISIPFSTSSKTQEVVYAAASARGGKKAKMAFRSAYTAAVASGDAELIGSYKSLSDLLDD